MRGRTAMKYGGPAVWHGMVQYSINAVKSVSAERAVIRWNLRVPVLRCCAAAEWIRTDHPWARTSRIELARSDACWKPGSWKASAASPGARLCSSSAPVLHRDQHAGREVCHPNPKSGLSLHLCTFFCSPATSGCMLPKSSQLCADPIPGSWLFGGLMGPVMPCWAASVRFWVSDTVPHLSTQGRSCTESAPVFLFPADLHAPAENPKSSETPDGTASKTAWSGKWKWFPRKAQQPVRTHDDDYHLVFKQLKSKVFCEASEALVPETFLRCDGVSMVKYFRDHQHTHAK
ncbi:hypothetical protein V8E51_005685 [Hyaloscypha variabilis]